MNNLISLEEEKKAKDLIYKRRRETSLINSGVPREMWELKRGDFVVYRGGSTSKYLIVGDKYRLTCALYRDRIVIINGNGKRMNVKSYMFTHDNVSKESSYINSVVEFNQNLNHLRSFNYKSNHIDSMILAFEQVEDLLNSF